MVGGTKIGIKWRMRNDWMKNLGGEISRGLGILIFAGEKTIDLARFLSFAGDKSKNLSRIFILSSEKG